MSKYVAILSSSVRGELQRRPAPTRADAFNFLLLRRKSEALPNL
jgi:hypothetical protein